MLGINTDNKEETHKHDAFDDFLDSLKEPREVIDAPVPDDDETIPVENADVDVPDGESPTPEDPEEEQRKLQLAMIPAETVVECIDVGFKSINSMIAQEDVDGATDDEKESLQKATANWLRDSDIDLSPGKMMMFLVLMIYGPKTFTAFQLRKAKQENERLKEENEKLKTKLKGAEK